VCGWRAAGCWSRECAGLGARSRGRGRGGEGQWCCLGSEGGFQAAARQLPLSFRQQHLQPAAPPPRQARQLPHGLPPPPSCCRGTYNPLTHEWQTPPANPRFMDSQDAAHNITGSHVKRVPLPAGKGVCNPLTVSTLGPDLIGDTLGPGLIGDTLGWGVVGEGRGAEQGWAARSRVEGNRGARDRGKPAWPSTLCSGSQGCSRALRPHVPTRLPSCPQAHTLPGRLQGEWVVEPKQRYTPSLAQTVSNTQNPAFQLRSSRPF